MPVSVFDMYRIGIGPSSSHTVGPMRAARRFIRDLTEAGLTEKVGRVTVRLMGSLAATGIGHATDRAVLLGLLGEAPDTVPIDEIDSKIENILSNKELLLARVRPIVFDYQRDMTFAPDELDSYHTNCMIFSAFDENGGLILREKIYSPGGGFIETEGEVLRGDTSHRYSREPRPVKVPYPFANARELISKCKKNNLTIAELIRANEQVSRTDEIIDCELDHIASVMKGSLERGLKGEGCLPGALKILRRAPRLYKQLCSEHKELAEDPLQIIDWINVWAMAVAEENASGGRVVTAPTNGACGVIPAALTYCIQYICGADKKCVRDFLLTAGAVGMIYKKNASISGAEVGCQGEIGVACSMAAAGLAAAFGGSVDQVENAAEIGMEHFLGLTCDPVNGQVQIPCIERNAIAAVKAINAARMAVRGNGSHFVSLDQVVKTMLETGRDMQSKYKETSLGGLAVSIVEC
jgi:L-serine dehydratase